jgi:hypothetical protein
MKKTPAPRPLLLDVKTEYFRQIQSGAKTEEYRLHNAYWVKRLVGPGGIKKPFSSVIIRNAYRAGPKNRLEFPWNDWTLKGITHPHFGPDEVTVFAIRLSAFELHAMTTPEIEHTPPAEPTPAVGVSAPATGSAVFTDRPAHKGFPGIVESDGARVQKERAKHRERLMWWDMNFPRHNSHGLHGGCS